MTARGGSAVAVGTRVLIGLVAAFGTAVIVGGALFLDLPTLTRTPATQAVDPPPGESTLVCPDTFLVLGQDATDAQRIGVAGSFEATRTGAEVAAVETLPASADAAVTASALTLTDVAAETFAAASAVRLNAVDVAGLAVAACRPALTESWLTGLENTTGSSGIIVLSNPGAVAATVSLTVFGSAGPVTPPGGEGVVVAPKSTLTLAVSAIAGTEAAPVIHVAAAGAPVQASVQSSIVRGLVPGGIDVLQPGAPASTTQVIPGVTVRQTVSGVKASAVRVLAPDADTTATVTVTAPGSTQPLFTAEVDLIAGIPQELPLDALPVGAFDVTVTAGAPLVAAAWQVSGTTAADDYAWFSAAPPVSDATTIAVAAGAEAQLTVCNSGEAEAVVVASGAAGADELTVAAGTCAAHAVAAGALTIDPQGVWVHASITYVSDGALAASTVWPAATAAAQVVITR